MITATLGGLIKDYRIKKRLSQIDVALKLGWKDTSRLSKIEQGRVGKPNRDTAQRIILALDLTEQERGNFLLVGGYLPTDDEVRMVISENKQKIDSWKYPAYLMDFSFRWLYTNTHTLTAANISTEQKDWVEKTRPNFLKFPFVPKEQLPVEIMKGEDEEHLKPFAIAQIAAFKTENEQYQNESWYKNLVKDLMQYDGFREYWPKIDQSDYHKKLFDYEFKTMKGIHDGKEVNLKFHLSTGKVISDPRFQVVLYFPADKETEKVFAK
ncbi:MAG: helix-turn-helix domain-containing protein [Candidatus Levybacteria bacterium]|nr:helix-turn-helix domain-containing protein [Candidatus Levybacteria bacterium]